MPRPTTPKKTLPQTTPGGDLPRFVSIRLEQIAKPDVPKDLIWTSQCGHQIGLSPTVSKSVLALLQITNPMIVVRTRKGSLTKEVLNLVAGRTTYALHREQLSGSAKVKALLIKDATALVDPEIYDVLVQRLLFWPSNTGLALVAAQLLKDRTLRERASAYFSIKAVNDVAMLLGMPRPTLYRTADRAKALIEEISAEPVTGKAGINILNDASEEKTE